MASYAGIGGLSDEEIAKLAQQVQGVTGRTKVKEFLNKHVLEAKSGKAARATAYAAASTLMNRKTIQGEAPSAKLKVRRAKHMISFLLSAFMRDEETVNYLNDLILKEVDPDTDEAEPDSDEEEENEDEEEDESEDEEEGQRGPRTVLEMMSDSMTPYLSAKSKHGELMPYRFSSHDDIENAMLAIGSDPDFVAAVSDPEHVKNAAQRDARVKAFTRFVLPMFTKDALDALADRVVKYRYSHMIAEAERANPEEDAPPEIKSAVQEVRRALATENRTEWSHIMDRVNEAKAYSKYDNVLAEITDRNGRGDPRGEAAKLKEYVLRITKDKAPPKSNWAAKVKLAIYYLIYGDKHDIHKVGHIQRADGPWRQYDALMDRGNTLTWVGDKIGLGALALLGNTSTTVFKELSPTVARAGLHRLALELPWFVQVSHRLYSVVLTQVIEKKEIPVDFAYTWLNRLSPTQPTWQEAMGAIGTKLLEPAQVTPVDDEMEVDEQQ